MTMTGVGVDTYIANRQPKVLSALFNDKENIDRYAAWAGVFRSWKLWRRSPAR
jgi:hypothetical protein